MEFRILGSVEVVVEAESILRLRKRERLMLGLLLLEANRTITLSRLMELMWHENPPSKPRQTLQVYASRLRAQLNSEALKNVVQLRYQSDGYRLCVDPDLVDAHCFMKALSRARETTDDARCSTLLSDALDLWQGPILADAADEELRSRIGNGLDQARMTAIELRIDADLALGRHDLLVAELADLTASHPTRERFIAQRMTALHRCGRTSDALDVYQECVAQRADVYGLDVGADLNRLYVALLRDDPQLAAPAKPTQLMSIPAQLPPGLSTFVGRERELAKLCMAARQPIESGQSVVCAVDGMAGVGKTSLTVRAAHQVAGDFPDGQLYIDLHGFTVNATPVDPADALDRMLRALGMPAGQVPHNPDDRAAAYRSILATKRVLILLDNAVDENQVRPLLPAAHGSVVLVTSRARLSSLDDAVHISLPLLTSQESATLLRRIAGEQCEGDDETSLEVGRLCGQLPLTVRIAATRLREQPHWNVAQLAQRLRGDDVRLQELHVGSRDITSAFAMSYQHLSAAAQQLFRKLALSPIQPMDNFVAAALAGIDVRAADLLLAKLLSVRVLESVGGDRYQFHDLTRQYALSLEDSTSVKGQDQAKKRLVSYCRNAAIMANNYLNPARDLMPVDNSVEIPNFKRHDQALGWLDENRLMIRATVVQANAAGHHEDAWRLCEAMSIYYDLRKHYDDWQVTHELGLKSAMQLNDVSAQAKMTHRLAGVHAETGRIDEAERGYRDAARLYEQLDNKLGQAAALNNLGGMIAALQTKTSHGDPHAIGLRNLQQAHRLYCEIDDVNGRAKSTVNIGEIYAAMGNLDEAVVHFESALQIFRQLERTVGQGYVLSKIAATYVQRGNDTMAITCWKESLDLSREYGDVATTQRVLRELGNSYRRTGQLDLAVACHEELSGQEAVGPSRIEDQCRYHLDLSETFRCVRRYDVAFRHWRSARDVARQLGDEQLLAEIDHSLSVLETEAISQPGMPIFAGLTT